MIGNAVLSALIRVPNEDRVQHRIITQTNLIGKLGLRFKAVKVIDNFLVFVFSGKSLYDAKLILNIMDQQPLIIILHLKHVIVIYIGFLFLKPQLQRRAIVVDFLDLIIYRQNTNRRRNTLTIIRASVQPVSGTVTPTYMIMMEITIEAAGKRQISKTKYGSSFAFLREP